MSIVVDASMAIAWLFLTERTKASRLALRRVATDEAIVPGHWRLEIANALRSAVRRGRCNEAYAERSLHRLGRLPLTVDQETNRHAWGKTRQLANAHNLTTYDAAYLELAMRLEVPLASCDADLLKSARRESVEVVPG